METTTGGKGLSKKSSHQSKLRLKYSTSSTELCASKRSFLTNDQFDDFVYLIYHNGFINGGMWQIENTKNILGQVKEEVNEISRPR